MGVRIPSRSQEKSEYLKYSLFSFTSKKLNFNDINHLFYPYFFRNLVKILDNYLKEFIMKRRTPITTIMTKDVITLNHTDDLVTAEKLFKQHHIRHIPVVKGAKIVGMLSYTDLLRISFADAVDGNEVDTVVYNMFTIEQVMAKNLVTVTANATIKEVAEILSKKEFHALPVIENYKLVGIVTTTDLILYLLEQY